MQFNVIVNGQVSVFSGVRAVSYERLVRLVYGDAGLDMKVDVTYQEPGGRPDNLVAGDEVFCAPGTSFVVTVR